MWRGELTSSIHRHKNIKALMKTPFSIWKGKYLTRLETRMGPASMTEDIEFMLDRRPHEFQVRIQAYRGSFSTLIVAARDGDTEKVRELLQEGADVNAGLSSEALILVAGGGHTEEVRILLKAGADVHAGDKDGLTALMYAARGGHTEVVPILLQAGAEVNAKNKYGVAALMFAARDGRTEAVKILLEAGADVNLKDNDGETALNYAEVGRKHPNLVELLRRAGAEE